MTAEHIIQQSRARSPTAHDEDRFCNVTRHFVPQILEGLTSCEGKSGMLLTEFIDHRILSQENCKGSDENQPAGKAVVKSLGDLVGPVVSDEACQ